MINFLSEWTRNLVRNSVGVLAILEIDNIISELRRVAHSHSLRELMVIAVLVLVVSALEVCYFSRK